MPKSAKPRRPTRIKDKASTSPRTGGTRHRISNSGLEVWLYDEANLQALREAGPADQGAGGMPPAFERSTKAGLVVGYSLMQDDDLDVEVHVGAPFSAAELASGRWLEPQTAWLRLPSGELCIESNDASRLGPESPGSAGARQQVPPGDHLLTLYRVDHEALDREGLTWHGAQEIIVLSPGGKRRHAASDLLPWEPRRDLDWVGKYAVHGERAEALIWFNDYWDTCFINLDDAALAALGARTGRHLRVRVPATGHDLLMVIGPTWTEAERLPPPDHIALDEYGYAAVTRPEQWRGAETLFCRRTTTRVRAEDAHQNQWLPAQVELLDARAYPPRAAQSGVHALTLAGQPWFEGEFLSLVLSDVLPGVDEDDEVPWEDVLGRFDADLAGLGFQPLGDLGWTHDSGTERLALGLRLYTDRDMSIAALLAAESRIECVFISRTSDQRWIVTGLADELGTHLVHARELLADHLSLDERDEALADMHAAHVENCAEAELQPLPHDLAGATTVVTQLLGLVYGK